MIVSHVVREKTAKDLHHLLKYADLQAGVRDPGRKEKVFLHVDYVANPVTEPPPTRRSARSKRRRPDEPVGQDWHELVEVHFHPRAERVMAGSELPWADQTDPNVVFGRVSPLPREVSGRLPRLRACVAEVVQQRMRQLAPDGLPTGRWRIHVALLPESACLEIGVTTWTDLRENEETIEHVDLP